MGEFSLNILDPAVRADPYPLYRELHTVGSVVRNPVMFGTAMVAGYDEAVAVLRDPATFSSAGGPGENRDLLGAPTMLSTDPPDHTRLRGVVARAFTPRALADLEPRVHEIATSCLSSLTPGRPFDLVDELAHPLPVIVIAELLGVAKEDRPRFRAWSDAVIGAGSEASTAVEVELGMQGAAALRDYFRAEIDLRRAAPTDDLVGLLVRANEGDALSEDELLAACVLLLIAGNETTTSLIGNAARTFLLDPDLWANVVAAPDQLPAVVDEALRYDGPIQATIRNTRHDTEIAGVALTAGSPVLVLLAAANRDPRQFDEPDRFRLDRPASTHLAFGNGIHYCLGSTLARMEARIAFEHLAARAPAMRLARPDEAIAYKPSFIFHGPLHLDIVT